MARRKKDEEVTPVDDEVIELEDLDMDDVDELEVLTEGDDEVTDDEPEIEEGLSAKEAAQRIGTDARSLRKFLRSKRGLVGQGKRWTLDPAEIPQLKADFDEYSRPKTKEVKVTAPAIDNDDEDDTEIEDLDFDTED